MVHICALRVSFRLSIIRQMRLLRHSATSPYGNSCTSGTSLGSNSRETGAWSARALGHSEGEEAMRSEDASERMRRSCSREKKRLRQRARAFCSSKTLPFALFDGIVILLNRRGLAIDYGTTR